VLVIPKDKSKNGVVLEFKKQRTRRPKAVEELLEEALAQIEEKKYETLLRERGIEAVVKIGVVIDKKEAWVKVGK